MSSIQKIQAVATPVEIQIRWSDQDVNAHVNNARILTLIEEARVRAIEQWTGTAPEGVEYRRAVRALNATFDSEVHYGPETVVWVWVSGIGNTSYKVGHLLVQGGKVRVYSEITIVVLDQRTGRPKPHAFHFRQHLEAHAGPEYCFSE